MERTYWENGKKTKYNKSCHFHWFLNCFVLKYYRVIVERARGVPRDGRSGGGGRDGGGRGGGRDGRSGGDRGRDGGRGPNRGSDK